MLSHSLATLEGCCVFVAHCGTLFPPLSLFLFCLFGLNDCLPAQAKQGMAIRSFSPKRAKKEREEGATFYQLKGGCGSTTPLSLRKFPLWKIVEPPWKEGEIRLEVDKIIITNPEVWLSWKVPFFSLYLFHSTNTCTRANANTSIVKKNMVIAVFIFEPTKMDHNYCSKSFQMIKLFNQTFLREDKHSMQAMLSMGDHCTSK